MQVGSRTLIMNPNSGTGDHAERVRRRARGKGFDVWETEEAEDGVRLGREAAEKGVSELAVCGGDGTINEVLRGAFDLETFGEQWGLPGLGYVLMWIGISVPLGWFLGSSIGEIGLRRGLPQHFQARRSAAWDERRRLSRGACGWWRPSTTSADAA